MALTVRVLAADPELGIRVHGDASLDRPITWVHVSELDDPTPFLTGGELLLTTGMGVTPTADLDRYVDRLCTADVVGLGFGVGLSFDAVPAGLLAAADRRGLPMLEIPRRTPFIAISRAVSRALAVEEYAAVARTFAAQQELTRAALSPNGPDRVLRVLARQVGAWVALVDAAGGPIALHPDAAEGRLPAIAREVGRLRGHRGAVGSGFEIDGDSVSLQPVGAGPRRRAFLAVGRPGRLTAGDRHLVNAAVLLLTLGLEQPSVLPAHMAAIRAGVLSMALEWDVERARSVAGRAGFPLPDGPLAVLVVLPDGGPPLAETDWPAGVVAAELDGVGVVVTQAVRADAVAAELGAAGLGAIGVSAGADGPTLAAALGQAHRAADAARRSGAVVLRFAEIGAGGVRALLDPTDAASFAESLLGPLVAHDRTGRGDLVASLRAWLAHHGQWDPAAAALGVHRHTLRRRIGAVEGLLGRDLDSPTVRAELWLAFEVVER